MERAAIDERQSSEHREKAQPIEQEERGLTSGRDDDAAKAWANDTRKIPQRRVQGDGVGDLLAPDQLHNERLARWPIQAAGQPQQCRQHIQMPDLYRVRGDQRPEQQRLRHRRRLCEEQDAPLGPAVGDDTAEEREEQHA